MEVWISSPVRSRKPVLMNTTRSRAARMHSFRFTVVRRSSSMMPTFMVKRGMPSASSMAANSSSVKATSSGPCIFGFTTYIEPARLFSRGPLMSCSAISAVARPSRMPSGISWP